MKVGDNAQSPTQKADEVRGPFDGPHRAKKKQAAKEDESTPAYVVGVSKREKARALLNNPNVSGENKKVLEEILGDERDT